VVLAVFNGALAPAANIKSDLSFYKRNNKKQKK
jgi:hypothetical protein